MRYTVAVDFDGVLHSYTSPWKNARTIPDSPVPGAMTWLINMTEKFNVAILSTRNHQWLGRHAMRSWLRKQLWHPAYAWSSAQGYNLTRDSEVEAIVLDILHKISFPKYKPAALVYIDDRAWRFDGTNWPSAQDIHQARPWNKKVKA